jgi:outer membrane protein
MNRITRIAACVATFGLMAGAASAADLGGRSPSAPSIAAMDDTQWFLHVGPAGVLFSDASAKVYVGGAQLPGASARVGNNFTVAFEAGYRFTPNISMSLTAGLPPTATLTGTGTAAGFGRLGRATYGPAVLAVQYRFTNFGAFQPYVGIGVNYTMTLRDKSLALQGLKIDNGLGFALQVGADYMFSKNWGVFVDVKKIFVSVDSKFVNFAPVPGTAKVKLDPWLLHTGLTYRF